MSLNRQKLRVRRDDGTDATLLRQHPTKSRSADAFVSPLVSLSGDDRVEFLATIAGNAHLLSLTI